jgi:hypothetical protein
MFLRNVGSHKIYTAALPKKNAVPEDSILHSYRCENLKSYIKNMSKSSLVNKILAQEAKTKVSLSPYLIKHHAMKTYGGVEVEFHTLTLALDAALFPGKEPLVQQAGWDTQPIWMLWRREKFSCPCRDYTSGLVVIQPID